MPRAFLIAARRFGPPIKFRHCDSDGIAELNVSNNDFSTARVQLPSNLDVNSNNISESWSVYTDNYSPNNSIDQEGSHCNSKQDEEPNLLNQSKLAEIKTILNLTPPSTPFQSSPGSSSSSSGSISSSGSDVHVCPDCGKSYSTASNLTRHRQTHRSVTDKKARKCPHCDKIYVSMPAYSMHVRTHTQGCQCHYCGKCFSRPWLLQGHIRTHTGEKPFKCHICAKSFADKSNLRAHVQTHSMTKPFICQRCGKAFALKSYLYKHEESSCMRVTRGLQTRYKKGNSSNSSSSSSSNSSSSKLSSRD